MSDWFKINLTIKLSHKIMIKSFFKGQITPDICNNAV